MTKILNESTLFEEKQIAIIEEKYNAKYVFESCCRARDGSWLVKPMAIFYTEKAHPEGSNYFAIYYGQDGYPMICDGISSTEGFVSGIDTGDGIIYSRHRHDYRTHNDCMVDGGRDYFRHNLNGKPVKMKVIKDNLVVVPEPIDYAYDTGLPLQ
jgi:hypothetical protein